MGYGRAVADVPHRVVVDVTDPERRREALKLALRAYSAGVGVDAAGAELFFDEGKRLVMETLGDLEFGEGTPDRTLDELATRVTHLLAWTMAIGFRGLTMLEGERGELDYMAALREIEAYLLDEG